MSAVVTFGFHPRNPEMLFVKRVIAKERDTVQSVDGTVPKKYSLGKVKSP
jgi:hypothetical protein